VRAVGPRQQVGPEGGPADPAEADSGLAPVVEAPQEERAVQRLPQAEEIVVQDLQVEVGLRLLSYGDRPDVVGPALEVEIDADLVSFTRVSDGQTDS
jgi:hypothetical protein